MRNQCKILFVHKIYYHAGAWRVIKLSLCALNYFYLLNTQYTGTLLSLISVARRCGQRTRGDSLVSPALLSCVAFFFKFCKVADQNFSSCAEFSFLFARLLFDTPATNYFINWSGLAEYSAILHTFTYFNYLHYLVQQLNRHMSTRMPAWVRTPRWLKKFDKKKYKNYTKIYRIYSRGNYAVFQRRLLSRLLNIEVGPLHVKYACILNSIATDTWTAAFYMLISA
jgi:hypothetical protein